MVIGSRRSYNRRTHGLRGRRDRLRAQWLGNSVLSCPGWITGTRPGGPRAIVGGCCVTEQLIPGFQFSTCANVLWGLRPRIIQDMRLYERGLVVDTREFLRLLPDGQYLYSGRLGDLSPGEDYTALRHEIAKFPRADAETFPAWQAFWLRVSDILGPFLLQSPPRLQEIYTQLNDSEDKQVLDTILTTSIAALADRYFESDLMRDVGPLMDIGSAENIGLLHGIYHALSTYTETGRSRSQRLRPGWHGTGDRPHGESRFS